MRKFLAVLLLSLPAVAASAQEPGANLGLETALGYGVSFKVMDEVIDMVDAAHDYYQENGQWPPDSTALVHFAQTETSRESEAADFGKYQRLDLHTIGADQLQIVFQLTPYETTLEEEGSEDIPLSILRAAGAIGMEPIARDSSRVIVHMDELEYLGGPDMDVEGELGGAEMEFEYVGEEQ